MRIADIRDAKRSQPFRPFVLHLADGRQSLVDHSESLMVGRNERTLVLDDVDGNIEIIDPMLVTSVTVPSVQSQS